MKYNQPLDQPSSPNAPYIDGAPEAGIQGSIIPAASIEFPQREIVNAILAAGLVGDNADLTQLLKMMKYMDVYNIFKVGLNQGSASQWSTTIPSLPVMPPPVGTMIWFKPGFASVPGGAVFSVNGSTFMPVVHGDLTPVTEGDIIPTGWLMLFFDGLHWQIVNSGGGGSTRQVGTAPILQKNADWYVNGSTGDDVKYDGTSATVASATVGPFKTIQRAANEILNYNMNNYAQLIHIADGTYVGATFRTLNGVGVCFVIGNPNLVGVQITAAPGGGACIAQNGGNYDYTGLRLSNANLDCIDVYFGQSAFHNMRFGPAVRYHYAVSGSGANMILSDGQTVIEAGANCVAHLAAENSGHLTFPVPVSGSWPTLNVLGAMSCSTAFMSSNTLSALQMRYSSIGGGGNVTGPKYWINANATIDTIGGGAASIPGSSAGSVSAGGVFVS